MEFDFTWVLLGFPIAFTLGWLASRLDLRQLRIENRQAPKAYFKGLNFLLNEQQDQAIDAFIEAVQNDPDTSELHFALGNLFRRRGEYERAVRVHEHLMSRGDLTQPERDRAQHALALDFLKAGLLDRAEAALRKLEGTPLRRRGPPGPAVDLRALTRLGNATEIAARAGQLQPRQLQHPPGALPVRAGRRLGGCRRHRPGRSAPCSKPSPWRRPWPAPLIDLAKLQNQLGRTQDALQTLLKLEKTAPQGLPLAAGLLANIAQAGGQEATALELLKASYANVPSIDLIEAIVKLEERPCHGAAMVCEAPGAPGLAGRGRQVDRRRKAAGRAAPHLVQRALDQATKPLMRYRCAACGFEATQHFWHCPGCQAWDSYPTRRIEEL